jgi:hypothetical protein
VKNLRKYLHRLARGAYLAAALSSPCCGAARPRLAGSPSVPKSDARAAEAVPVDHAPKLDGTLSDPLWLNAKPISDFRQREPFENKPPTEATEVRILYTRGDVAGTNLKSSGTSSGRRRLKRSSEAIRLSSAATACFPLTSEPAAFCCRSPGKKLVSR